MISYNYLLDILLLFNIWELFISRLKFTTRTSLVYVVHLSLGNTSASQFKDWEKLGCQILLETKLIMISW